MKTFTLFSRFCLLLTLAFFTSCLEGGDTDSAGELVKFNLFDVQDGIYLGDNQLQGTIQAEEDLHIAFFGSSNRVNSLLITDEAMGNESVILLDENQRPAFSYVIDSETGKKEDGLVEFETIQPGSFFMRFYHYDWDQRIGTLLAEIKVTQSGSDWTNETTFTTSNKNLDGVKARTSGKGGSFYSPIPRLDLLRMKKSEQLQSEDLLADFQNFFTTFRNEDVPRFLAETIQPYGDLATVIGGIGVLAGSAAFTPILLGGVAISAGTRAISFFQSDRFENFLDGLRNFENNLTNGINEFGQGTVEVLTDYSGSAADYWNNLVSQINPNMSLEEILADLEQKELINSDEDLDDLPDSEGVIHIAMSWNTNNTDIDLWVKDPSGTTIYYQNPQSSSGGYLDLDDVDGFGPENIYWRNGAPNGSYSVIVHYYGCEDSNCQPTSYTVKVSNGLGTVRTYEGILGSVDSQTTVVTFTKQGTNLNF